MTHLKPRTVREWLDLIPYENARRWAIENYDPKLSSESFMCPKLSRALDAAFNWRKSKQKEKYWVSVYYAIKRMEGSVKLKQ